MSQQFDIASQYILHAEMHAVDYIMHHYTACIGQSEILLQ